MSKPAPFEYHARQKWKARQRYGRERSRTAVGMFGRYRMSSGEFTQRCDQEFERFWSKLSQWEKRSFADGDGRYQEIGRPQRRIP